MNTRSLIFVVASAVSLALFCCAFVQHARLEDLRNQQQRLQGERQSAASRISESSGSRAVGQADAPRPVSSELLKLRNQVSQLTRQRDELAFIGADNERLKAQAASRATNGPGSSGYIRKSEAKFAGYDTPESTLQTFLWAIRNKDFEAWLNTMAPELTAPLRKAAQEPGFSAESMFEGANAIPGLAVISLDPPQPAPGNGANEGGETISAHVQIAPGMEEQIISFRRVAGQWKMARWP